MRSIRKRKHRNKNATHKKPQNMQKCLGRNHNHNECYSKVSCRECGLRHHQTIHKAYESEEKVLCYNSISKNKTKPTIIEINVRIGNNTKKAVALLDTGSSQNFISQEAATEMEKKNVKEIQITGLNNTKVGESSQVATIRIVKSRRKRKDLNIKGYILNDTISNGVDIIIEAEVAINMI
jgi:type II secretory pathway component PulC